MGVRATQTVEGLDGALREFRAARRSAAEGNSRPSSSKHNNSRPHSQLASPALRPYLARGLQ